MKRDLRKSKEEKQETELVIKLNGQVVLEKAMVKNLTILDTTLLAVSIMFLPVLFHGTPIVSDNHPIKREENDGPD